MPKGEKKRETVREWFHNPMTLKICPNTCTCGFFDIFCKYFLMLQPDTVNSRLVFRNFESRINISPEPRYSDTEMCGYLSFWSGTGRMALLKLFFIIILQSWVKSLGVSLCIDILFKQYISFIWLFHNQINLFFF